MEKYEVTLTVTKEYRVEVKSDCVKHAFDKGSDKIEKDHDAYIVKDDKQYSACRI